MSNGNIDYDYDEVISYIPTTPCTAVNDLANNLNTLGTNLTDMEKEFHSINLNQVAGKIYKGFSNIIGDDNNGLSRLVRESANVLNICYNEAESDKAILETGEMGTTGSNAGTNLSGYQSGGNSSSASGSNGSGSEGTSNMQMGTESSSWDGKNLISYGDEVHTKTGNVGKEKVQYTDEELKYMAQMVKNESGGVDVSRDGAVAVAEEIRNRVLSDDPYYKDSVQGVIDQGYAPYVHGSLPDVTEEDIEVCRNVLNGTEWIFDNPNVLSHASHNGNYTNESQQGISGSQAYTSFYYDNMGRTQTFFTS